MFQGKCHCGNVMFEVEADLQSTFKCNCTYCVRRAATMLKILPEKFLLKSDESKLGAYGSRDFSKHYFCKNCGINCFTRIKGASGISVVVNVGCLEGIDSFSLSPTVFDGANKL